MAQQVHRETDMRMLNLKGRRGRMRHHSPTLVAPYAASVPRTA